jgi:DNA-binding PadR family transcriptional regulator
MKRFSEGTGRLPEPALYVLLALGTDAKHGYAIMRHITEVTGGATRLLPGTLYSTIKNLLGEDLVEETDPPADADSDDARRRYYRVTRRGRRVAEVETRRMQILVKLGRVFLT